MIKGSSKNCPSRIYRFLKRNHQNFNGSLKIYPRLDSTFDYKNILLPNNIFESPPLNRMSINILKNLLLDSIPVLQKIFLKIDRRFLKYILKNPL